MGRAERRAVDCHVHLGGIDRIPHLVRIADEVCLERMSIVCTVNRERVNANPSALVAKARHPGRFFLFAGLDHTAQLSGGSVAAPSLAEQVDLLIGLGADGVKMLENKPTTRKILDLPVDGPYFADYFARLEETGLPVLWHVNDPVEFWDPAKTPSWAKERGWGYDDTFPRYEDLYVEVERVLARHPRLTIIFAHFYFLSADLPRAAELFEKYPGVHFDLAPGIEMLYNTSGDVAATREFFITHAERILFGTDISSGQTVEEAAIRAGIVRRWLETDETYRVPPGADFLLGPPEDGVMRGMSLPEEVLAKIYCGNFERIAGREPKPLVRDAARAECERLAREIDELAGGTVADNPARQAAAALTG